MDDIDRYLKEDLGDAGDITSNALFTNETGSAYIIANEDSIVAGLEEAETVFLKTGAQTHALVNDGDQVNANTNIAKISGPLKSILCGERLALNFICRMSGIASETHTLISQCHNINPSVSIAATRKTTPGFRHYEKKAVIIGGGEPHRQGLYEAILIKDNHIKAVGSLEKAITRVKQQMRDTCIEVEVEKAEDAYLVAKLGVDTIMLDNFNCKDLPKIVEEIKKINKHVSIELSGGINPKNIRNYAPYADRISLGYLTHSTTSKDFSLELL